MAYRRPTAADIAETALREIGALPPTQAAPLATDLTVAVAALDEVCGYLGGKTELPWLMQQYDIALLADTETYDLSVLTKSASGCDPSIIEHWIEAWLVTDATSDRREVMLLRENEWNARGGPRTSSRPCEAWISRRLNPILHVRPTVATTSVYTLELHGQQESVDLTANNGAVQMQMPKSWVGALVSMTAAKIGGGRVRRLPEGRLNDIKEEAARQEINLLGYSRPEHQGQRIASSWGLD